LAQPTYPIHFLKQKNNCPPPPPKKTFNSSG